VFGRLCRVVLIVAVALASAGFVLADETGKSLVQWQPWTDDIFTRATAQKKPVLLDLQAIWCHWCHVMDAKTYSDPKVAEFINTRFIPVQVDQDSRPDLSNRYENYGWPATVFFQPGGKEIEIRSGFIKPDEMISLLQSIAKHPNKVRMPSALTVPNKYSIASALDPAVKKELEKRYNEFYDNEKGGWGFDQKFIDYATLEYALDKARTGDKENEKRAKETLAKMRGLIDPVWGGVYQYSTDGDWNHPHFEKIMQFQAEDMRIYALAYALWHDPADLKSAQEIEKFLHDFLLADGGAFYTSMDADLVQGEHSGAYFALSDADRRKQGIPRIDKHIYSRENGWAINALTQLYMSTGDERELKEAEAAASYIQASRALSDGGFKHDENDPAGPYLGDTLAMGRAFLNLYTATGDRKWLNDACTAADFIEKHFNNSAGGGAGYATADLTKASLQRPQPLLDENVMLANFANLLNRYTGKKSYENMAKEAMRYLATPEIAESRHTLVAGVLLADEELAADPMHATIIGAKSDPGALALFQSAIRYPSGYKRIEWLDEKEGPLPNPDVDYPAMDTAAAFICIDGRCSSPVFKPEAVAGLLKSGGNKE
jgi:hypothetical protein